MKGSGMKKKNNKRDRNVTNKYVFRHYRKHVEDFNVSFERRNFVIRIEYRGYSGKVSEIMDIVSAVIYFDMFCTNNDKWKYEVLFSLMSDIFN